MAREIGLMVEGLAKGYLKQKGYEVVANNYRHRLGEIDLIVKDKNTLVFVEVRYRKSMLYNPLETVDSKKQRKIIKAASAYMQQLQSMPYCRFDVIAVCGPKGQMHINHILDAFRLEN